LELATDKNFETHLTTAKVRIENQHLVFFISEMGYPPKAED